MSSQQLSDAVLQLQLRSKSNLAFLGHGVSEDQHIFLEAIQSIRLAVPLWYLVPCRLRYHDEQCAVVDPKGAIDRVEILIDKMNDDEL